MTAGLEGTVQKDKISFDSFRTELLADYRLGWLSRHASILIRKEVLSGKAKFGIAGAGKELPQLAMAKAFKKGDYRAGYYRDQTWALATGIATIEQMFSLLYSNPDVKIEPHSAGRQMSSHFASRWVGDKGEWKDQTKMFNAAADVAPTASQMGRAVGLALASKVYRNAPHLSHFNNFSRNGNEVAFATIGDASTSEGIFWEAVNAAAVQQIPLVVSVWDDGYGISVAKEFQTAKASISEALSGFGVDEKGNGMTIYNVKGWDYPNLVKVYQSAVEHTRKTHIPALIHVEELTQPQGHSTSGSHERYKSEERLQFEKEFDCLRKMREWLLSNSLATLEELEQIEHNCLEEVKESKDKAWKLFNEPVNRLKLELTTLLSGISHPSVQQLAAGLNSKKKIKRSELDEAGRKALLLLAGKSGEQKQGLISFMQRFEKDVGNEFNSHLYLNAPTSAMRIREVKPEYSDESPRVNGFEVLQKSFAYNFEKYHELIAFGEDLGKIGGVNQGFAGLQDKFGENRIWDTGIRELTIIGQGIGTAMRGLRPIAEIQYLDYLVYGLQQLTDELATLTYRTKGGQKAPMIVRTRGHRLEGIWHTGSPMSMILGSMRGIHVCVPRNMVQAAGFYNTLLAGDDPGLVIEPLNAYRFKELLPANLGDIRTQLGKVEVLQKGSDVTLVTYGSCVRVAQQACKDLEPLGISVELVDVRSLLPFDTSNDIVESLKETNRLVLLDEDVPGGGTAFMLQKILEEQNGYAYLDSKPVTITSTENRTGYGSEHGYFGKPQVMDVVEAIYGLMHETDPDKFPLH